MSTSTFSTPPESFSGRSPGDPRRNPWLVRQARSSDVRLRLFCLPYAGGAASLYRHWQDLLPDWVQLCAVELPGHGFRMAEEPALRLAPLVRSMVTGLKDLLDTPYAVFGHSMGGLLAFEFARTVRELGLRQPEHLFLSGVAAPGLPPTRPPMGMASTDEIRQELAALKGTPRELLENDELMELMLPVVRADFCVLETYWYRDQAPLDIAVTVFGGSSDPVVPSASLSGWSRQSSRGARLRIMPGDHFFLHSAAPALVSAVAETLDAALSPGSTHAVPTSMKEPS
jgi:medium-chain acyl-[acyl-carrier-protein] hydrolase